ncbi:MAG: 3-hydroxymyristoyl/3-hydroxydecanoyl-(acyl carrier protein) dehydratase [Planctomycetota bacterium]|jgi:3-hydroxymyristoyl/3-hydroxydecanoyl-(acyl carrier protein) dehydratase
MAVQPILDLNSLDRKTVLHDREALYALLPQRGTFSLVDGVLHMDMENNIIVGYRDVLHDEWWCQDHIPGNPIFPGAMMVEASAQLGTFHFYHCEPGQIGAFIGFTGIDKTRFRGTVSPGCRLYFIAKAHRMRKNLFTYIVQGVVERNGVLEDNIVFQTEVTGMVLVPAKETA